MVHYGTLSKRVQQTTSQISILANKFTTHVTVSKLKAEKKKIKSENIEQPQSRRQPTVCVCHQQVYDIDSTTPLNHKTPQRKVV